MLLSQCQGLRIERMAVVRRASETGPIGRLKSIRLVAETLEQMADGAGAEVQMTGDGGGGLAAACLTQDESTEGQRD
jgi:hypothetical protein